MLAIEHPKLQQLFDYWASKSGERKMPSRADIDPLDLTFIIGNVILVDVIEGDPLRFRIRLHGTNLTERVGYELTGKMLDELPQAEFRELSRLSFTKVANSGKPLQGRRDRILDGRSRRYETIILPLSGDDARVDMLLCGLIYDDEIRSAAAPQPARHRLDLPRTGATPAFPIAVGRCRTDIERTFVSRRREER